MTGILSSPFVIFAAALGAALLLLAWGKARAPSPAPTPDKVMPYIGGEAAAPSTARPGYGFFVVALFFTLPPPAPRRGAPAPPGPAPGPPPPPRAAAPAPPPPPHEAPATAR